MEDLPGNRGADPRTGGLREIQAAGLLADSEAALVQGEQATAPTPAVFQAGSEADGIRADPRVGSEGADLMVLAAGPNLADLPGSRAADPSQAIPLAGSEADPNLAVREADSSRADSG